VTPGAAGEAILDLDISSLETRSDGVEICVCASTFCDAGFATWKFYQVIEITAGLDKVSSPVHLDISTLLSSWMSTGNSSGISSRISTGNSSVHVVLIGLALLPLVATEQK
jgi:hypothetical protein